MGPNLGRFLGVLEQKLAGKRLKIDDLWLDVGSFLLWDGLSPAPLRRFLTAAIYVIGGRPKFTSEIGGRPKFTVL
jgi:hypothetical protein